MVRFRTYIALAAFYLASISMTLPISDLYSTCLSYDDEVEVFPNGTNRTHLSLVKREDRGPFKHTRPIQVTYCKQTFFKGDCRSPTNLEEKKCYQFPKDFQNNVGAVYNHNVIFPVRTLCHWFENPDCTGGFLWTEFEPDLHQPSHNSHDGSMGHRMKSYMCSYYDRKYGNAFWPNYTLSNEQRAKHHS